MTAPSLHKGKYKLLSESNLRRELSKEGYSVFSWQDRPGAAYSAHSHPHDEYIVVHDGSIEFMINGHTYVLEAGDALLLPANTIHEAVNRGVKPVHYLICTASLA